MKYVDLVIDNKSDSTDILYTYGCEDDSVCVGSKVYVPFARSRNLRDGYVAAVSDRAPEGLGAKLRYVDSVDPDVSLTPEMVRTALWMRQRYLCRYIDAIKCFTPAGSKLKKGTRKDPFAGRQGVESEVAQLTKQQNDALAEIGEAVESGQHEKRTWRF